MNDMDTNDYNSVLLIGGRDAGKSNFLFRLWIAIDAGGGTLVKDGLPSEIDYLRAGAEQLLEGEFAERTPPAVHERVVVPVKSSASGTAARGTLVVPDVPGEQVLAICRDRQWSRAWEELISRRCACLLFVRAASDEVVAPLDWASCFEKYGATIEAPKPAAQGQAGGPAGVTGTDSNQTDDEGAELPTQVVLTEWLQFLRRAFTEVVGASFRPRVGVVISAWDAVPIDGQPAGPIVYLKDNFPMLHQFIEANGDRFDFQVFGVSIVAGDLKNDEGFKQTYLSGNPRDFGFVIHALSGNLTKAADITLPVAWALRLLPHAS
jgi:double-GTPase-like protein